MFRLTRPSAAGIDALLAARRDVPFTYVEVGATRGPAMPAGYTVDRRRVLLGSGGGTWASAVQAMRAWRMTTLGWAAIHPAVAPIAPGTMVAMVVRHYGFWSVHPCRLVYALDDVVRTDDGDVHRFAFAYGTLPGHVAAGEERFALEWRRADDTVWYELSAFSRARQLLARLGHPLARRQQRRFGRDSTQAMVDAVRSAPRASAPGRAP